jgi:MFS family permease
MAAGAVLGGLAAASRRGVSYRRLLGLTFAMGISILAAAAAPTLLTEVAALFVMGAASFAFIATANTTLQLTSRPEMRGRVMALYAIAFLGSTPVGSPIVGWICAVYGPRAGFALGGVAAIVAGFVASLSFVRMRTESDERVGPPVTARAA